MKLQKCVCRILVAMLFTGMAACIDEGYRLDEVSTEVTLISGKTKLFVGELPEKTLGEWLGETEVEGLTKEDDGNFTYNFSDERRLYTFDAIERNYSINGIKSSFLVDYPHFDFDVDAKIDEWSTVETNYEELTEHYPQTGTLTEAQAASMPNIVANFNDTFKGDDMHLIFDVPDQIRKVKRVYLNGSEVGSNGARLDLSVDLRGYAGINNGGEGSFKVTLKGGTFQLIDIEGNPLEGNSYSAPFSVAPGAESVEFSVYVQSIEIDADLSADHQLSIPLELDCEMTFSLKPKAGDYDLTMLPHFKLNSEFVVSDVDIIMNDDEVLVEYTPSDSHAVRINNLPNELKAINAIELETGTQINFYAEGLEWLGDNAEKVAVDIVVPEYIILGDGSVAEYTYDKANNRLTTTLDKVNDGLTLAVERLDFGSEGLVPDEDGAVELDLSFNVKAYFVGDHVVRLSSIRHDEDFEVTTGVEDINLVVEAISGRVDYTYTLEQEFDIKVEELNIGEVTVGGVGLSPVITINIENPLTMPLAVDATLSDDTGRKLEIGDIELKAATYENGVVVPARSKIVIANQEPNYDCIYVHVDFDELLKGTIPSQLSVKLDVGVDSGEVQTLYIADEFIINYDYSIALPVALNHKLDVSYADEFYGFADLFTQVADYDIHVGDVVLVAEVTNTTPLALMAEAKLLDKDGNEADLKLQFEEGSGRIGGSADGVTPAVSTLRLNVVNRTGTGLDIVNLAEVDGISFGVVADSADVDDEVALNENQMVGAKLWLEIDGGLTLDLEDYIKMNE